METELTTKLNTPTDYRISVFGELFLHIKEVNTNR